MIEDLNKNIDINRKIDEEILEIINKKKDKKEEPAVSMYSKMLFATAVIVVLVTALFVYKGNISGTIFGCTSLILNWMSFRDSMK